MSPRPAIFLDRDGTLVADPGYLADPGQLRLLPGAAEAVRRINAAGWAAVVVTNQSGIARGLLSEADYAAVARRLAGALAGEGARLDGQYHCPHLPELTGPCRCRKPGPALYQQAARDLDLDLAESWLVGDRVRDVAAAPELGARGGVLIGAPDLPGWAGPSATSVLDAVATCLSARAVEGGSPPGYLPAP